MEFGRGFTLLISGGCKQINKQQRRKKVGGRKKLKTTDFTQPCTHSHTMMTITRSSAFYGGIVALYLCVCLWAQRKMHFLQPFVFRPHLCVYVCVCVQNVWPNKWTWWINFLSGLLQTTSPHPENQIPWSKCWFEHELCVCGGGGADAGLCDGAAVKI